MIVDSGSNEKDGALTMPFCLSAYKTASSMSSVNLSKQALNRAMLVWLIKLKPHQK